VNLPDLIEIVPIENPVSALITVPGSKSITNRALILAALGSAKTTLEGALWSEDTQVMMTCLQKLGFVVNVQADRDEPCNRTITVWGKGGTVPDGGTEQQPLELFVGNAGTAARFLAAFVCLGRGCYRLHGVARMHERPQTALFDALRELGYRIDSPNDRLPATLYGAGPRPGQCRVSIEQSSQFASALLLCARIGGWKVEVAGGDAEESAYVAMTNKLIAAFPEAGGGFRIEPDASSGSYFIGIDRLLALEQPLVMQSHSVEAGRGAPLKVFAPRQSIRVPAWPSSDWQIDAAFRRIALTHPLFASERIGEVRTTISRRTDLGDSILTAMILAPFAEHPIQFTDLERLRLQECERVSAIRTELTKCGVKVVEEDNTLTIFPSAEIMHGAEIETYNDHRVAMCFGALGTKLRGIQINNPSCVKKTFPDFFQKVAAQPPSGLGAIIQDARTGRRLGHEDLFAR
jgi:3-phosphoshikimate 1-carboxyvinyltransferase